MDTKAQRAASACMAAISELSAAAETNQLGPYPEDTLTPIRVLLDEAQGLVDGKGKARDKKNAGDRKRRAEKKSPGKKGRKKRAPAGASGGLPGSPPAT